MGRPTEYTAEKGTIICEAVEAIVGMREIEALVNASQSTIYRWLEANEEFRKQYARARANQGHSYADQIQSNVQRMLEGEITPEQCRVANDALKWSAGKRLPTVYGDKLNLEHSGNINHTANPAEALSTETLETIERELAAKELPQNAG